MSFFKNLGSLEHNHHSWLVRMCGGVVALLFAAMFIGGGGLEHAAKTVGLAALQSGGQTASVGSLGLTPYWESHHTDLPYNRNGCSYYTDGPNQNRTICYWRQYWGAFSAVQSNGTGVWNEGFLHCADTTTTGAGDVLCNTWGSYLLNPGGSMTVPQGGSVQFDWSCLGAQSGPAYYYHQQQWSYPPSMGGSGGWTFPGSVSTSATITASNGSTVSTGGAPTGSVTVYPNTGGVVTYTLSCNSSRATPMNIAVNVMPPQPTTLIQISGYGSSASINMGQSVTLNTAFAAASGDAIANARIVDGSGNYFSGGGGPSTGFQSNFTPAAPGTYTFYAQVATTYYAYGSYGSSPATVTVTCPSGTSWNGSSCVTFNYSLSSPSASVTQGSSNGSNVTATLIAGSAQTVSYSFSGLPSGVTVSPAPSGCSTNGAACSFTLNATSGATTGPATVTVTGTASGGLQKTTTFSLTVSAATPTFNYSLSAPAVSVTQGSNAGGSVTATLISGSSQTVSYAFSNLPTGITISPAPSGCSTNGAACSFTVNASGSASSGTVTITGTASGGLQKTTTFTVTANPPAFNYSISAPAMSITKGSTASGSITATLTSGSSQTVSYAFTNLPSGVTVSTAPSGCSTNGAACTFILSATSGAVSGTATITGTASGGLQKTTTLSITATAPATVTISSITASATSFTQGNTPPYLYWTSSNASSCWLGQTPAGGNSYGGSGFSGTTFSGGTSKPVNNPSPSTAVSTGALSAGSYTYYLRCADSVGNMYYSPTTLTITVNTPVPPSGSATVTATPSSNTTNSSTEVVTVTGAPTSGANYLFGCPSTAAHDLGSNDCYMGGYYSSSNPTSPNFRSFTGASAAYSSANGNAFTMPATPSTKRFMLYNLTNGTWTWQGMSSDVSISDPTPSASITIVPSTVNEGSGQSSTVTFTLSNTRTSATTINYSLGGTATNGVDYGLSFGSCSGTPGSTAVVPANSSSCSYTVTVAANSFSSGSKTVTFTPASGSGYTAGSGGTLTINAPAAVNPTFGVFFATPPQVHRGASTVLAWTGTDLPACTVTGPGATIGAVSTNIDGTGGSVTASNITQRTTFTLTCGGISTTTTVTIFASYIEI